MVNFLKTGGLGAAWLLMEKAHAQVYGGTGLNTLTPVGGISTSTDVISIIVTIINFLLNFVLILAILAVVVAGMYLVTSGGDEGQKDKAKNIIFYALAGIALILLSRVIVLFVNSLF